nr:hypothetical protein [Allomuricauda sp.]|tara:strand:- start:248 stop:496 length:249 start_codon:yes stop_codon:yes gene_type:complete
MAFEKQSSKKLKSLQSVFFAIALIGLFLLCFLAGVVLYGMTHGKDATMLTVIPALLFPTVILPLFFVFQIRKEIKKRKQQSQ